MYKRFLFIALNYDYQSFTKKLSAAYFLKKKGIFPLTAIGKTQGKQLARNFAQEIRRVSMIAIPVIETQKVPISYPHGITLYIKREDKTHVHVSGNKYRKLKYNLLEASQKGYKQLITFGGAYSNHIAATAYAGKVAGIETIGVIRGDELASAVPHNPTLSFAKECGMRFNFVSRERFRLKHTEAFKEELANLFGTYYYVPEGGTNALAIKGTEEILTPEDADYDFITTAVGTGGTIAGLINSALPHQKVLGFPALCGKFLEKEIQKWIRTKTIPKEYQYLLNVQNCYVYYFVTQEDIDDITTYVENTTKDIQATIESGEFSNRDYANEQFFCDNLCGFREKCPIINQSNTPQGKSINNILQDILKKRKEGN